ncbi:hypothetical protein [Sphingosinithalassobacter portus]|uniref:hypothetical protein n=1 Tax=Stakelama portus TaxID=2676234 RepID=UPI0011AB3D5B|nr:hypothetical protein [Sphingosinithalassobacter portus]
MSLVGKIVSGSTRLIFERPGSILMWGLLLLVGMVGIVLILFAMQSVLVGRDPTQPVSPGAGIIVQLILQLLYMALTAVIGSAVFRAALDRENARGFSIRFSADELRVFALLVIMFLLYWLGAIFLGLVIGFLSSFFTFASQGDMGVLRWLTVGLWLILTGFMLWVWVRLSTALPLVLIRKRISIDNAWDLTRGHFWQLLAGYLIVGLIAVGIMLALLYPFFGDLFHAFALSFVDPDAARYSSSRFMGRQLNASGAVRIGQALAMWLAVTIAYALNFASVATATRWLLIKDGELEEDELY